MLPLNFIVIVELAAKPLPDTITAVPTGPFVGLIFADVVMVKVVVAVLMPSNAAKV